jgi:hypothetical protein
MVNISHALDQATRFFEARDLMNAAVHCDSPRWSAITELVRDARFAEAERRTGDDDYDRVLKQCEYAWTIIANAYGGDWDSAPSDWRNAAERWRDHYHEELDRKLTVSLAELPIDDEDTARHALLEQRVTDAAATPEMWAQLYAEDVSYLMENE